MTRLPRRDLLLGVGSSIGAMAVEKTLPASESVELASQQSQSFRDKSPKAKAVIMLVMEGGPSQLDTFDPKPVLRRLHGVEANGSMTGGMAQSFAAKPSAAKRYYVGSPFRSRKTGQSGIEMSDPFVHLAEDQVADEICLFRGCQAESEFHCDAMLDLTAPVCHLGNVSFGARMAHALDARQTESPPYVVMFDRAPPQAGIANWTSGSLPSEFHGATETSLAIRTVPIAAFDLHRESASTQAMYGIGHAPTDSFGRKCLVARRLVEHGTRFVQLFCGGWDSHNALFRGHASRIRSIDQPFAALIRDLKKRGMLDQTLVFCAGEFGRTPDSQGGGKGDHLGRDHNPNAMSMWFAGGGFRRGVTVGATDELGARAVECVRPLGDVHTTIEHTIGLDVGVMRQGNVISELLA
ncbi:hypothetical protein CA13_43220 [Planctomycetes bacterium CA13]|uniref:Sulfatase n=1 Tax=Novipirellula herctigrandis TaxID=2527986 RepID=A0A5C5Z630_9BACT|nr:hypothetical protein CA13_43220 [Planctomycetes bacterium CA13]